MPKHCPVEGCETVIDSKDSKKLHDRMEKHLSGVHGFEGDRLAEYMYKAFPYRKQRSSPVAEKQQADQVNGQDVKPTEERKMADGKGADPNDKEKDKEKGKETDELSNLDEVDQLGDILKDNQIKKWKAIIKNFQYHDLDDLEYLERLLRLAGVQPNTRKLVVETWSSARGLDPNEAESVIKKVGKKESLDGDSDGSVDDDEIDRVLAQQQKKALMSAERAMKMREYAVRMKQLGLNPTDYGLPDVPDSAEKKKEEQASDESEYGEYEWPPDSGKMVKMKHERYTQLLYQWNKAHGKIASDEIEKKEKTIPWINPYTNQTIEVPQSQYAQYMQITQQYNITTKPQKSPDVEALERRLDEQAKLNNQLIEKIHQKEVEDAQQAAGGAWKKAEDLEKKVKEFESRDPMEVATEAIKKFQTKAQDLGMAPKGRTTEDEIRLKKADMNLEVVSKSISTVADKVKSNKIGTGEIADKVFSMAKPFMDQISRDMAMRRRMEYGEPVPHSDAEIDQISANLQNAEIQQNVGETAPPAPPPVDPAPESKPTHNLKEFSGVNKYPGFTRDNKDGQAN